MIIEISEDEFIDHREWLQSYGIEVSHLYDYGMLEPNLYRRMFMDDETYAMFRLATGIKGRKIL